MTETKGTEKQSNKIRRRKNRIFERRENFFVFQNTLIIIYLYIKHIKVCESESERHIEVLRNGK